MIPTAASPWTPRLLWLAIPQLIGATAWWYIASRAVTGKISFAENPAVLLITAAAFGVIGLGWWIGTMLFGAVLLPQRKWRLASAVLSSLPLWFFLPMTLWTGAAWLILLLGLGLGVEQAFEHAHNSLIIRTRQVIGASLGVPLLAILLSTSLLYYQHLRTTTATPDILATRVVDQSATTVERALPSIQSGYRIGMTVDELLGLFIPTADDLLKDIDSPNGRLNQQQQAEVRRQLAERGIPVEDLQLDFSQTEDQLRLAIDGQIQQFRAEIISNLRTELSRTLRVEVQSDQSVHSALQQYFSRQFDRYIRDYVNWLPPLLALALFFTLRLIGIIFQWGIILSGWLWYRILRLSRVLGVVHETVPAERLTWNK